MKHAFILWIAVFYLFLNANNVNTSESAQPTIKDSQIELKPRVITRENFDETINEPLYGTFVMYQGVLN